MSILAMALSGCAVLPPELAAVDAQPVTRPARNFTSFNDALRCMDTLLVARGGRTILLSSTDIPDKTRKISVGADDMLINALVRMTVRSRAYGFLDQGLVKDSGLIDLKIVQKDDPPRPDYYIRGSISQLDAGVSAIETTLNRAPPPDRPRTGFDDIGLGASRSQSVVTLDLHLVGYPSRQIVPGASVSNSIAVQTRRRSGVAAGFISLSGLDLDVSVARIESPGQAVRNLVEVSLIELIGRHANVPYWTCLSAVETDPNQNRKAERAFHSEGRIALIREAQRHLIALGRLTGSPSGRLDQATRNAIAAFQADEGLLVNGIVDFDLVERLRRIRPDAATKDIRRQISPSGRREGNPNNAEGFQPITGLFGPSP